MLTESALYFCFVMERLSTDALSTKIALFVAYFGFDFKRFSADVDTYKSAFFITYFCFDPDQISADALSSSFEKQRPLQK